MKMRLMVAGVLVGGLLGVGGCAGEKKVGEVDPELVIDRAANPDARYVEGTLIEVRPTVNALLISTGRRAEDLNMVLAKYDAGTKFYLQGEPVDLTALRRYMPVRAKGVMREGQFVLEVAKFSAMLPANAPAGQE